MAIAQPRGRRDTMLILIAILIVAGLVGSKLAEGPAEYTAASTKGSRCGRATISVGGLAEPVLDVDNTSPHDWRSSYLQVSGSNALRVRSVSLDDQQAEGDGGGVYELGPLGAGRAGQIKIGLAASATGIETVRLKVWGSAGLATSPDVPQTAPGVSCRYTITR